MKIQIIFLCFFFKIIESESSNVQADQHEYLQKINELKSIKEKLQKNAMLHHEELFANLQTYGRAVGQVATSAILIAGHVSEKNGNKINSKKFSTGDCVNIVQSVVAGFILMVELAKYCHARNIHKKFVKVMTYQDFSVQFPHLVLVEYHILLMKTLLSLSQKGDFGQQVFARIALAKMSLPYPFDKFANKAAKKLFKKSFDKFGNFVWTEWSEKKDPYKKFSKNVAQNWQEIALRAHSFSDVIEAEYYSTVAQFVDTFYNNALIKIINAGMQKKLEFVAKMRQEYLGDNLIEKLCQFYVDQNNV